MKPGSYLWSARKGGDKELCDDFSERCTSAIEGPASELTADFKKSGSLEKRGGFDRAEMIRRR